MRVLSARGGSFRVEELAKRDPGRGEVRVGVRSAAVNPADYKVRSGRLAGRVLHASTAPLVLGYDFSGTVEKVGEGVTDVSVGEDVFGHLPYSPMNDQGTFAESVVVRADSIARKPRRVSHETAAAAATAGLAALQALRDDARVRAGHRVMIIGAAGGVGSLGVGVAKKLGAHVTAVCSASAVDFVKRLGADEVVDLDRDDPLAHPRRFDAVFDTPAAHSFAACRHLLVRRGTYVTTLLSAPYVAGKLLSLLSSKRCELLMVKPVRADLELLAHWLEDGLHVEIAERHPVREAGRAVESMAQRDHTGRLGRVAIAVAEGW